MPVKLTDKVYSEGGSPVQGAIAQAILTNGTTNAVISTDTTDTKGIWAFDSLYAGHQPDLADPATGYWYDVRINVGVQYRLRYGAIKAMMSMVHLAQTIVLSAGQLFDTTLAQFRIPVGAVDRATPAVGDFMFRSDLKTLRVYDGSAWLSPGTAETACKGATITTGTNYTVGTDISYVFCTASVTVTLPSALITGRPVTIQPNFNQTVTVNAVSGTVYGGSINQTTGAVMNGTITATASAMDSVTYKADGANWRAV